jgi:restriction system protein
MLGYSTQRTKATGDQGIDIIAEGKGRRLGIQCKGYEASVGNHAVQEAYAGKEFYQCDSCAMITNSSFTRGAVDLATSVNCTLISGNQFVQLIMGRLY